MPRSILRVVLPPVILGAALACDGGVAPPPPPTISLLPQGETISVGETLQLSATLVDPSGDAAGAAVTWTSLEQQIATVSGTGLVLGVRPGSARIVAAAAGVADTGIVEVARTPATLVIEPVPDVAPGEEVQLRARVTDTEGGTYSPEVEWSVSDGSIASITSQGVLTGVREGSVRVTATAAPASDEVVVEVRVPPPPPGCDQTVLQLAVGEARTFSGGGALTLCLSGGEYLVVAANADSVDVVAGLAGFGVRAPAATTSSLAPSRAAASLAAGSREPGIDRDFERRLRRREREELNPRAARRASLARTLQVTPTARAVGDLMPLNTATSCVESEVRGGRVEFVGERAVVVADTLNPSGLVRSDYARFGALFDTLLYPVVTEHFGEPARVNDEPRVVIFYTAAVNELTPAGSQGVVGGFFWSGDLFPVDACAGSNERAMFYLLAADPQGTINGNQRTVAYVERVTAGTIAHELQHLINASRRVFVTDALDWEVPWLNEGLSHVAEELVFYDRSRFGPRRNLGPADLGSTQAQVDITNRYAVANLLRVDRFLRDVERQGPFQDDDDLETRGAAWQFLRYALDRHGGDPRTLLSGLVDSRDNGLTNFEGVFAVDAAEWFVDEAVSVFADDWATSVDGIYTQPSWNFRALLEWINTDGFVILSRTVTDGSSLNLRLQSWGAAYLRTAVANGRVGSIQVGREDEPSPASLRVVLVRTR